MYQNIKTLIESAYFQNFIIGLIILNGITMGLETSKNISQTYGGLIELFDVFVITVFTIEILLRIFVHRVSFFKDSWSIFDFIIVAISLVPAGAGFDILRVLRVLRLFRLITVVPQMRKIVSALLGVIPGMLSIAALMGLFFYVFSIMAVNLYGEAFPQWFGTLGESFYTLFQVMTLESWSMGIVRPIMEAYPNAWAFFIPFVFIATFVMINLIVAIVVDAMAAINKEEEEKIMEQARLNEVQLEREIASLRSDVKELKEILLSQRN
ncbi:MAG: Voltage-gated sodium channel subunit [uncultured Sulfurovum sp.]|uniref:Voltage-gated sodium channel subunit n=1 Tax=uncultured Sulfurovum sp. TaxID=269237 RepID=A0A6S6UEX9_9BACT|nr:MAG: Voltage-gated sodium channel subunit [uncultured Sulfurovum sp.]